MEQLLNTAQVAEWMNVAESTIRKWVHYGFIPHYKIGSAVRFTKVDLEKWLKERAKIGRASLVSEFRCK